MGPSIQGAPKAASAGAGSCLDGAWVLLQVPLIVGRIHLFATPSRTEGSAFLLTVSSESALLSQAGAPSVGRDSSLL